MRLCVKNGVFCIKMKEMMLKGWGKCCVNYIVEHFKRALSLRQR